MSHRLISTVLLGILKQLITGSLKVKYPNEMGEKLTLAIFGDSL
jgi:hypothetical protein